MTYKVTVTKVEEAKEGERDGKETKLYEQELEELDLVGIICAVNDLTVVFQETP